MNSTIFFLSFFILLLFGIPLPLSSYSQLEEYDFETAIQRDNIYAFVQIQVRDIGGNLVGYIETDRIVITDIDTLHKSLDDTPEDSKQKKKLFIDNQEYEVITGIGGAQHQSDTVVSLSAISSNDNVLAYANHDGYPVKNGDEALSTWTIIRPVA